MFAGQLALVAAALFTGAAVYIYAVEHPSRLGLDDKSMLLQWQASYRHGAMLIAALALLGFMLGFASWLHGRQGAFLIGSFLMLANAPLSVLAILPTSKVLIATPPEKAGSQTRALMARWNMFHAVRAALGILAGTTLVVAMSAA